MWRGLLAAGFVLWPFLFVIGFLIFFVCFFATIFLGATGFIIGLFVYGIYAAFRDSGWMEKLYNSIQSWRHEKQEILRETVEISFPLNGCIDSVPRNKPVLYVCHPHGLFGMTWFFHFSTGLTKWPSDLPRPRVAVHRILLMFPFVRELSKLYGAIEASEEEICKCLESGESVAILLGGVEEIYYSEKGKTKIVVEKRKGYARIAKKMDCPLVPLISVGESEIFSLVHGAWFDRFQQMIRSWFSIYLPVPTWKSLCSWFRLAWKPLETPVETWCLEPVFPKKGKGIEKLKEQYIQRLREFAVKHGNIEIVA
jgi:hypothetical protein